MNELNTITSYPAPPPAKAWWKSKTVWFNAITTVIGVAGVVPHPAAFVVAGLGNIVLRVWFTEAAIKLTNEDQKWTQ